ncbi:MAG: class I SAM-dependent RNA methyltransferase [Acidobacteriota bacterium]|nr:class I SAM-dependent RNA methyltransferase [Acidobacteriota bacterium]
MEELGSPTEASAVRVQRAATGGAVGRLDDGRVVFVRHSLPGELVDVRVTERTRSFARGDAVRVLEASPERVVAPCPYARPDGCGGCDLQHASEDAQRSWKATVVAEHLWRIGGLRNSVNVESAGGGARGSRTRLRCAVSDGGRLALRATRSHRLVELDSCWIADERLAPAFSSRWPAGAEVELRAIGDGEPFAVARREGPNGPVVELLSLEARRISPATRSEVVVADRLFLVSPTSFWQSHREAPPRLVEAVLALAALGEGDSVVDLYSGVGLFAVPAAMAVGPRGRITSVESSPVATGDARANSAGLGNLTVREWSVSARAVHDTVGPDDVVIVDPPRHGLSRGVAPALVRRRPRRIVYVSCDAAALARDLKVLVAGGYRLSDLRVLDLFPMTEHVELVGLLDIAPAGEESGLEATDHGPLGG